MSNLTSVLETIKEDETTNSSGEVDTQENKGDDVHTEEEHEHLHTDDKEDEHEPLHKEEEHADDTSNTSETNKTNDSEVNPNDKPKESVKHTKEEKEKYAWEKTNKELAELREANKKFQEQLEKIKPKETPKKYKKDDFVDEESYFKYLANESLKERLEKAKSQKEEFNKQNEQIRVQKEEFDDKVKSIFESNSDAYYNVVNKALENGMSNYLDKNPDIMKYIMESPISPKLAFHFAVVPNDLIAIAKQTNPQARYAKLSILEDKLSRISMFNQPLKKQGDKESSKEDINIGRLGGDVSNPTSELSDAEAFKIVDELKRKY